MGRCWGRGGSNISNIYQRDILRLWVGSQCRGTQGGDGRRLKDTVKDGGCNRRGEVDGGSWSLWRC